MKNVTLHDLDIDCSHITDNLGISNGFNTFFTSVGTRLRQELRRFCRWTFLIYQMMSRTLLILFLTIYLLNLYVRVVFTAFK